MTTNTGRPRLRCIGARIYYAALFLCPPAFRREFSTEMTRDVDDAAEDMRSGGAAAALLLWLGIAADLAAVQLEADSVQREQPAVPFGEAARVKHGVSDAGAVRPVLQTRT